MSWVRAGLFAVLLLVSFALRVHSLGFQSIWTDEGFIVGLASRSFWELVSIWNVSPQEGYASLSRLGQDLTGLAVETDIHPPLYYFLVHFWMLITGSSEYVLRFPAVLFGVLTIPLLYTLGKRLAGRGAALFGSSVAMLSPFYLDFSQQVRMYTLVTFLAALSMYSFERAFRDGRRAQWITYALATGLALYVHYFVVTVVLVQAVIVGFYFLKQRRVEAPGYWLASMAGAVLLLAPWIPYALRQVFEYQNRSLLSPDWQTVFSRTWQTFNLGVTVDPGQVASVLAGMLVIVAAGLAAAWRSRPARGGLTVLLLYFLLPILVGLAILQLKPMFHPKYFMMASPAYYLLLGVAISGLWRNLRWVSVPVALFVLAGLVFGVHSYFNDARYWKDDTRAVGRYLEDKVTDQDLVVSDLVEPLGFYYKGIAPAYYLPGDESTAPERLELLARERQKVFLVHYEHSYTDPQGLVPFLLERASDSVTEKAFRGYSLKEYLLRPDAGFALASGSRGPGTEVPGGLALEETLIGGEGPSDSGGVIVPSGGRLWSMLSWRLDGPAGGDFKASISLVDSRGHLAAQKDSPILRGIDPTSRWTPGERAKSYFVLPLYAGIPPGDYRLRLTVYAGTAGSAAPWGDSRPLERQLELGRVNVGLPRLPVKLGLQEMGVQSKAELGPIEGIGYTFEARELRQGDTAPITLFLQSTREVGEDLRFRFELRDLVSWPHWAWEDTPQYPTSQWRVGDGVREWHDLIIPGRLPAGQYRLLAGLVTASGTAVGSPWDLGTINVAERPRNFTPPVFGHALDVSLGGKVALLGYDIGGDARPAGMLNVSLYWKALAAMDVSYAVFVHLLDAGNRVVAQHDGVPGGDIPTSGWLQGEIVRDQRTLAVPAGTPAGEYTLEVGMYDPASGQRLAVPGAPVRVVDDALWIQKIEVK